MEKRQCPMYPNALQSVQSQRILRSRYRKLEERSSEPHRVLQLQTSRLRRPHLGHPLQHRAATQRAGNEQLGPRQVLCVKEQGRSQVPKKARWPHHRILPRSRVVSPRDSATQEFHPSVWHPTVTGNPVPASDESPHFLLHTATFSDDNELPMLKEVEDLYSVWLDSSCIIVRLQSTSPRYISAPTSGEPQVGFILDMVRISSWISLDATGRPGSPWRQSFVQCSLKRLRCHRRTVSGFTKINASFQSDQT